MQTQKLAMKNHTDSTLFVRKYICRRKRKTIQKTEREPLYLHPTIGVNSHVQKYLFGRNMPFCNNLRYYFIFSNNLTLNFY